MENRIRYNSKKDLRLVWLISLIGLVLIFATAYQLFTNGINHPPTLPLLVSLILLLSVVFLFAYPVSYEISPPDLLIRSGVTRFRIPLSSIESVQPSRNPYSSPALSLDRLKIDYKKKGKLCFILISPENKKGFLNELARKDPELRLQEEKIIRYSGSG